MFPFRGDITIFYIHLRNHIHLNPWKIVRYCKLESKKWRYVLIRCVGAFWSVFFLGTPMGPPGPTQGSSVLLGWAGAANPMGWVGFGLQWSHVVGRCILCLIRNTSCIIMYHNVASVYTINYMHTRVYVSYVYDCTYIYII